MDNLSSISTNMKKSIVWASAIAVLFLIFYVAVFISHNGFHIPRANSDIWGQFGSYIGGVITPVFTFFSLLYLIRTVDLQKTSISLAQDDAKAAKEEAKEARQLAKDQLSLFRLQRFETTFFNMINQIPEIMKSYQNIQVEGNNSFNISIDQLQRDLRNKAVRIYDDKKNKELIDEYFNQNLDRYTNFCHHIGTIRKFIDEEYLQSSDDAKLKYDLILDGFLSNNQKVFLGFCYYVGKFDYFKSQIHRYSACVSSEF